MSLYNGLGKLAKKLQLKMKNSLHCDAIIKWWNNKGKSESWKYMKTKTLKAVTEKGNLKCKNSINK